MIQVVCPHCGQAHDIRNEWGHSSNGSEQQLSGTQAQLLLYARDLAKTYAVQKLMAQYLPGDLRDRVGQGSNQAIAERRCVTILFADLVGFTQLASHLDPEEIFSLMNVCFRRLAAHVFKYGGVIDKFLGDGLMALFGAPTAHEDDPERAVRAALDMQTELQALSAEIQPYLGFTLQLHIGINSGEVIAGSIGLDEQLSYTVMGEAVNLAIRLQEAAEPGSILVGEPVYRRTKPLFDYEYLGELEVKGYETRVPIFRVRTERETPGIVRPASDILFPWIGRERELKRLADLSHRLASGQGGVAVVLGEAGLGKTRLVHEWLTRQPAGRTLIWQGSAQMFRQRISYSLWRALLRDGLHLRPANVSAAEVATRQALLAELGDLAPFILALVHNQASAADASQLRPEGARSQTFQAVRELLAAQARRAPLILVVDNWHWVDDLSRDLLLALLPLADGQPILFCILSRPGIGLAQSPIGDLEMHVGQHFERIELKPLGPGEGWEMLSSLIITDNLAKEAQSLILSRSQGNPLYLTELLRLMAAEDIARPAAAPKGKDARWQVAWPERLASLHVPPTLSGLTQANLDRLPLALREILSYAAVIGPAFSPGLLQAVIARERQVSALAARLEELVARGFIEPASLGSHMYAFRHAIVQETIYHSLLSDRRRAVHRLIADELEILPEGDVDASVELMAHHFLQAGVPAKAVPYLIRAGRRAQNRGAYKLAVEHYRAALAVLDDAPRYEGQRLGLEMALGETCACLGRYEEAVAHYQSALSLSAQAEQRADIQRLIGATLTARGDWKAGWVWLDRSLECLAEGRVPATSIVRGQVYADCAQAEWCLGDHQQAELWAREAIVILEGTPARNSLACCYRTLGHVYQSLGQASLAEQYGVQAAAVLDGLTADPTPGPTYLLDQGTRPAVQRQVFVGRVDRLPRYPRAPSSVKLHSGPGP
jgi:class 3 adenylate cyclase/tetratricopeptide (TPR) repeat protein